MNRIMWYDCQQRQGQNSATLEPVQAYGFHFDKCKAKLLILKNK